MIGLGIAPSEFWQMPPRHFWVLVGAKRDEAGQRRKPKLSKADKDAIRAELMGQSGAWF